MAVKRQWGRLYKPDKRDKKFLMDPSMRAAAKIPYKYWFTGIPLDQGNTPQCVGFSGYNYLRAFPIKNIPAFSPSDLYKSAQENDEWEGEDYDGTSVRGLFKYLNKSGYVTEYRWTWDVEILAAHILTVGPVVVGTDWYSDMMELDSKGILHPDGYVAGGHAYLICGCNQKTKLLRVFNSWGSNWGENGRAWIKFKDFQKLLDDDGEGCVATEVKRK